jgi:hypothetical protein
MSKGASVVFSNYNFAFLYFNQKYVELCLAISLTMSLRKVRRNISTFMYEFSYAIPYPENWETYKRELARINKEVNDDENFNETISQDELNFRQEVAAYPSYYKHLIDYLFLLSKYVSELSATYLPRTNFQKTLLSFKNDSPFYDKLHEYKREVYLQVSDFNLFEFRTRFNHFLTFFYAYNLFINKKYVERITEVFSSVLSIFLNEDTITLLAKEEYSKTDIRRIAQIEETIHSGILYCSSLVNSSLSDFGVLPKLKKKVYSDRTLI